LVESSNSSCLAGVGGFWELSSNILARQSATTLLLPWICTTRNLNGARCRIEHLI
jgi:hypothetical protein